MLPKVLLTVTVLALTGSIIYAVLNPGFQSKQYMEADNLKTRADLDHAISDYRSAVKLNNTEEALRIERSFRNHVEQTENRMLGYELDAEKESLARDGYRPPELTDKTTE